MLSKLCVRNKLLNAISSTTYSKLLFNLINYLKPMYCNSYTMITFKCYRVFLTIVLTQITFQFAIDIVYT